MVLVTQAGIVHRAGAQVCLQSAGKHHRSRMCSVKDGSEKCTEDIARQVCRDHLCREKQSCLGQSSVVGWAEETKKQPVDWT